MKKVLVITYYWPPSGGAAVQRWLSFSRLLCEQGIEVHVLTVDEKYATYPLYDTSLEKEIIEGIRVYKTKTAEPFELYKKISGRKSVPMPAFSDETNPSFVQKIFRFVRGNFFIPDPRKGWKPYAIKKAVRLIADLGIDNVITAGPPHSTHFIGQAVKKQFDIQWITDFHDLWTDVIYYKQLYHLPIVKRMDSLLERTILEQADRVMTVGDLYMEKLLSKSPFLSRKKFFVARMGYDEELFAGNGTVPQNSAFTIAYTGTMADFYKPEVFFDALKNVLENERLPVKLIVAGVIAPGIARYVKTRGLNDVLDLRGYVSHRESIKLQAESDVLLLVNPVTENEDMVIPSKIYEYLASGRSIINITNHTAEIAAIITRYQAGKTFARSEQGALEAHLLHLMREWQARRSVSLTPGRNRQEYSRRHICQEIAALLR